MEAQEYNKEDASKILGVSIRTLQRLTMREVKRGRKKVIEGKIPSHKKKGPKGDETWYFKKDLDAYLAEQHKQVDLLPPGYGVPPDTTTGAALVPVSQVQETLALLAQALEEGRRLNEQAAEDRRLSDDRFLTLHEASEQFGLSLAVLRRAVEDKALKLYPVGRRGAKVLRLSEVRAFIRAI